METIDRRCIGMTGENAVPHGSIAKLNATTINVSRQRHLVVMIAIIHSFGVPGCWMSIVLHPMDTFSGEILIKNVIK